MPNQPFEFPRELYAILGRKIIESIESDDFNEEATHFVAIDLGLLPSNTGADFDITVVEVEEDDSDIDFDDVDINFDEIDLDNLEDIIIKKAKVPKRKLLAHLPTYRKIKQGDTIIDEPCPICQDLFKAGEFKRKLEFCNHIFHKRCVDRWLCESKMECPLCRTGYENENENENAEEDAEGGNEGGGNEGGGNEGGGNEEDN